MPVPTNVKIYDRPKRTGPSPLVLLIALLAVLIVGFLLYKAFYHSIPPVKPQTGIIGLHSAFRSEGASK